MTLARNRSKGPISHPNSFIASTLDMQYKMSEDSAKWFEALESSI